MSVDPLVVTLGLDDDTTARFEAERRALFPPGRTQVGAHLTLFHAVPGTLLERVHADLAAAVVPAFDLRVGEVMALGRGAAYRLEAPELTALHDRLQRAWWDHLTRQDQQGLRPHVTVQNKVTPDVARATLADLRARFTPTVVRAESLLLWRYVGGPWEPLETFTLA